MVTKCHDGADWVVDRGAGGRDGDVAVPDPRAAPPAPSRRPAAAEGEQAARPAGDAAAAPEPIRLHRPDRGRALGGQPAAFRDGEHPHLCPGPARQPAGGRVAGPDRHLRGRLQHPGRRGRARRQPVRVAASRGRSPA